MDVIQRAGEVAADEARAWSADPLRYLPDLKPFVDAHRLAPAIEIARELAAAAGAQSYGRPPGYPWQHGLRVARHALRLCDEDELASLALDRPALFCAALFHDICHTDRDDDHQRVGADLARRHLVGCLDGPRVEEVARWVEASDRWEEVAEPEQKVLWDANALDLHGCMYLLRGLAYGVAEGVAPEVLLAAFGAVLPLHRAWIRRVHYKATRRLMLERARHELAFLRDLAEEIGHPALNDLAATAVEEPI